MSIKVGQQAPGLDLALQAYDRTKDGGDDQFQGLKLSDYNGKWVCLFFYPLDFTFVCPSEILAMGSRTAKLNELGCEVVGVSVDSHFTHNAWRNTEVSDGGIGAVPFTLAADMTRKISKKYGILSKGASC